MELTEAQLLPFATESNPVNPSLDGLSTNAPSGLPSVGVGTRTDLLLFTDPVSQIEFDVKGQESSPAPASLTGTAFTDVGGATDAATSVTAGTFGAANADPLTGSPGQPATHQIVVIDPSVGDWQNLAAGVTEGAEVFVLDATKDGVEQIAQRLAGRTGISGLHIVSHGSTGSVSLGNSLLSVDTIIDYAIQLHSMAGALSAGADIVLYGCEVGAGVAGEALTRRLAQLTGADVAASDDPTGSAAKGGDWVLECATGTIEAPLAFQSGVMEAYDWVLLPAELFISEYVEGSGNNKALEFYNGTGAAIDLAAGGYAVDIYSNGSATVSFTHNLTGTVASGDVYVLALNNNTNAAILAEADQTNTDQFSWYNGDDAVVLRKGATVIDAIGQVGFDPGNQWGAGATSTQDNTIRRNPNVTAGDTNPSDAFDPSLEWIGFANNTYNGLGSHNSAPAITLSAAGLNYTENAGAVLIDGAATLTDSDSPNFNTGNLTASIIAGGAAEDRLAIRNQGTAAGEIGVSGSDVTYGGVTIGTFTGGTGTALLAITFNASATPAAAEALLRNITYENISENPSTGSRTVQLQVTDQLGGVSNAETKTVSVTAVNDAPVLDNSGSSTLATINQNDVGNQGTSVSDIIGSSITDADTGAVGGIAVTGTDTSNGTWEYSTDGGTTWTAFGAVSDSSATVLTAASANRIRFLPSNNFSGTASITYRAWDTADGSANGTAGADASINGGATAFSTEFETADITVTASTRIREIQGAAHISPKNGESVTNVTGTVTATTSSGFYMQDPNPDADDATSEGIFVFTSSAPAVSVGDSVLVNGTVSEVRPDGVASNLSVTQIANPTIAILSSGNSLPTPIIIGSGGRTPPAQIIDNDAAGGNVENAGTAFDPSEDGIDFYESLEGMLVGVNNAVAVGPTSAAGTIPVLADGGAGASVRTPRGGIVIQANDFNPERIIIDDEIVAGAPQVSVGDSFSGAIAGVMDYSAGNFKLLNTSALPSITSGGLTKEVTSLSPTASQLTVATFNLSNLDPGDSAAKFANLASTIVSNLQSPDILAVQEIQDSNGATNDSVVDASATYAMLIAAIQDAGGPTYEFRQIDPVDDADGGEPGGNIRVGFLFNPTRVSFADRAGGSAMSGVSVINNGGAPELSASPGRIEPANWGFNSSRKPLAGEFVFNGQKVFAIVNHFNAKLADEPLFGVNQPAGQSSQSQRNQQAAIVANFIKNGSTGILDIDPNANVVVLGDLNDFEFSSPLNILKGAGLSVLAEQLPAGERYTYNYEGNSRAMDHILVSGNLLGNLDGFDIVHVNSEFAFKYSDHDPSLARFNLANPELDVSFNASSFSEGAGAIAATGTVTRTGTTAGALTVSLSSSDTTEATVPLTVTIPNGAASVTFAVGAVDDPVVDGLQPVTVTASATNYIAGAGVLSVTDDDTAGVVVSSAIASATEGGAGESYQISLQSQPASEVTVQFDTGSQIQPIAQLTFTPANWNNPQVVIVAAVEDAVAEGNHTGTITHTAVSADANYSGIGINATVVSITDNDSAGVTVSQTSLSATEGGAGESYQISLQSQPASEVTVQFDTGSQIQPIAQLTFTPANWNNPQVVIVAAVEDAVAEGNHTGTITHTAVSADANYSGIGINATVVSITDNDSAGVTVSQTSLSATEGGAGESYQISLQSQPASEVTVQFDTGSQIQPIAQLTFTPANWNNPQVVIVAAVEDAVAEGNHTGTITHTAVSADANYSGIGINATVVSITDNDSAGVTVSQTSLSATEGG
ncbi:DUF4347 domain-containing protein, partial [Kamptonema formosum]|uniref:DUF4347 domain-containing protein n=1 Tax=Kamptonema formosum TaxID=331992 RepID=UPI0012DF5F2B